MRDKFKINIIKNKSTTYLLPYVHKQVNFKFFHQLVNTYLSYENGDDIFCVMYDWDSRAEFIKFEGELMSNHLYLGHTDYGDKVVFKFKLSRLMKVGRDLFIQGKYKEFDIDHKKSIMDYLNEITATNAGRISQILSENMELSSTPPIMENEVLENHVKKLEFKIETFNEGN